MLWLLAPFVRTAPLPPPPARWEIAYVRKEDMTPEGVWCAWEAESLHYDGKPVWGAEAPDGEGWCRTPGESARMVDVLGENGPFLSLRLTEWSCCPEQETVIPVVTYDVVAGTPTTLEAYDPKAWKWRSKRLRRLLDKKHGGGWSVEPSAFVIDGAHVRVRATRGDEVIEIPLR